MHTKNLLSAIFLTFIVSMGVYAQTPATPDPISVVNKCEQSVLYRTAAPAQVVWYWQGTTALGTDLSDSNPSYTVSTSGTYYLRAFHTVSGEWSAASASVVVNVVSNPVAPSPPVIVKNCGNVTLTEVSAPLGVSYFWQTSATGKSVTGDADSVTYEAFKSGDVYSRARLVDAPFCWSAVRTDAVTVNAVPDMPTALSATAVTGTSFTANWSTVVGASTYFLDVSTTSNFAGGTFVPEYENHNVGNVTTQNVTGLTNGTTYYYRVRAHVGTCTSVSSNTIPVTTVSCNPQPEIYVIVNDNILENRKMIPDFELNTKFGNVQIEPDEAVTKSFEIFNKGDADLIIISANFDNSTEVNNSVGDFTSDLVPVTITQGSLHTFSITFNPSAIDSEGIQKEIDYIIQTNDPKNAEYRFKLGGYSVDNRNGPSFLEGTFGNIGDFRMTHTLKHRGLTKAVTIPVYRDATMYFLFQNAFNTPNNYEPAWAGDGANAVNNFVNFNVKLVDKAKWWSNAGQNWTTLIVPDDQKKLRANFSTAYHYTFITNLEHGDGKDPDISILETLYEPTQILSVVKRNPFVYDGDVTTIDVTISKPLEGNERAYIRYTADNWGTKQFVPITFTGTTGEADIPASANTDGTTVIYYALTTEKSDPQNWDIDFYTLAIDNNTGSSNYDYTVLPVPTLTIAALSPITEGAEDGSMLTATLSSGIFATPLNVNDFELLNLPTGVTIGSVTQGCRANQVYITLQGNATTDYDVDIAGTQLNLAPQAVYGIGHIKNGLSDIGNFFKAKVESAELLTTVCLSDATINNAEVTLTLKKERFSDINLNPANFTLHAAPVGVTIQNVIFQDAQTAILVLAHNGTSPGGTFNFSVTINQNELFGNADITTDNTLEIKDLVEPTMANKKICGSGTITMVATAANTVQYSLDGVNSLTNAEIVNIVQGQSQTVFARIEDGSGCASEWVSATATAHLIPSAVIVADDEICDDGTYDLEAIIGNEGETVDFSINGGTSTAASDNTSLYQYTTPSITAGNMLTVSVRTRNTTTSCFSAWADADITAFIVPSASLAVSDDEVCESTDAVVTITTSENLVDYEAFIGGTSVATGTGDGSNLNITIDDADLALGNNTITLIADNGDCQITLTDNGLVSLSSNSIAPTAAVSSQNNFCIGDFANISLSYSGGNLGTGAVATWFSDASMTSVIGAGSPLAIDAPMTTSTYYVSFSGVCNTTAAVPVTVTLNSESVAPDSATPDKSGYCEGDETKVTLSYTGGDMGDGAQAQWYADASLTTLMGTGNNLEINAPAMTSEYYVVLSGVCNTTPAVVASVEVNHVPDLDISPDTTIGFGANANLWTSNETGYSYAWTPAATLSNSEIYNPIASPAETTEYTVVVTSEHGCIAEKTVIVTVEGEIVINTGFTPNDDGYNETWVIEQIEFFGENDVEIYNRQGVLVYKTHAYNNDWKGTYMDTDKKLPVGTYYFLLNLNDGTPIYTGSVTIIK